MLRPMNELPLTNNCVVVCDLALWDGPSSACWHLLTGSQCQRRLKIGHFWRPKIGHSAQVVTSLRSSASPLI
jgi:hypothetical protein